MFGLGPAELLIVGLVAVLLFGKKLPDVARSLGGSYREFRKGLNDFQSQMTVDTYRPSTSYSSSRQSYNNDYTEEPTAPKFEPPPAEPTSNATSAEAVKSDSGEGTATV
jgi:sec-independent protein translocase protein TatA